MKRFIYIIALIFLVAFYSVAPSGMNKVVMTGLLAVALLGLVLFFFKKEKNIGLRRQYLKHSTLALLGIIIVFFQYPLDYVLGNVSSSDLYIWVNHNVVSKSLALSVIGLFCFLLGYLFYRKSPIDKRVKKERLAGVGILNILAALALIIYFLTINPLYLSGYYGAVDMGANASYAIQAFELLIFAVVIQKCRNMLLCHDVLTNFKQYLRKLGWPLLLLTGIYLLSVIISGDRGPLIYYGLLFFSGYFMVTKKKLTLKYALLLIIAGVLFIAFLGTVRNLNKGLSFSEKVDKALNDPDIDEKSSISPPTLELAASVRTLNTALNYVPKKHNFFYGRFQFQQIMRVIPFFNNFSPLIFHDNSTKFVMHAGSSGNRYSSSASYITWIRRGDFPTMGDGTSCMTDFYLDFGLIGVILGMLLFGYLMRFSESVMYRENIPPLFAHVFCVVYLTAALYIARGTLFADLKTMVWVYVILLINKHFLQITPDKRIASKYLNNE